MYHWPILTLLILSLWVACLQLCLCEQVLSDGDREAWAEFKIRFNKTYTSAEEELRRMAIFVDNRRYVDTANVKLQHAEVSFEQGINSLSDLTTEEINSSRNGFRLLGSDLDSPDGGPRPSENLLETLLLAFNETSSNQRAWYEDLLTRRQLDYRDQGRVSRVKDQGDCGSCWAFATTGALESVLAARGQEILLSEQNLVDCSTRYGNNGCRGGLMDAALRYVRDHGIMASKDYPYTGDDGRCKARSDKVVMRVRGSTILPRGNEVLLRLALALTGPLPVAIDASARSFHSYKSGVYHDSSCKSSARSLNHAVLLVGYGTSSRGDDYWVLKNSWGRSWGDNGYINIARNKNNMCGVASFAVLPLS